MSDIQKKFGETLREIRKGKNLSQEDVANRSKLHRTYISDIERGARNVSLVNIEKIAKALGITPKSLLD
jgi:transcriptional regulator with XRE-family HTH domain